MQILEELRTDKAGRLCLTKVFEEMPTRVLVVCDTEDAKIILKTDIEGGWTANQRKVDDKNRIMLPRVARDILGDVYYLTPESKKTTTLLSKEYYDY